MKKRIHLNEAEWRLVLHALNEVMMKIIKAPIRKVKIK